MAASIVSFHGLRMTRATYENAASRLREMGITEKAEVEALLAKNAPLADHESPGYINRFEGEDLVEYARHDAAGPIPVQHADWSREFAARASAALTFDPEEKVSFSVDLGQPGRVMVVQIANGEVRTRVLDRANTPNRQYAGAFEIGTSRPPDLPLSHAALNYVREGKGILTGGERQPIVKFEGGLETLSQHEESVTRFLDFLAESTDLGAGTEGLRRYNARLGLPIHPSWW